jgi:hypothetical protein
MDHRTEAACLLETGALYRRRIALETATGHGEPIFAGFKRGAFSLYFGDEPIFHFDLEGRWQRAFVEGVHYLKGLDGDIHAVDRVREGPNLVLRRRKLDAVEAIDLDARIRAAAIEMRAGLGDGRFRRSEPPPDKAQPLSNDEVSVFLESISNWDCSAWLAHSARYGETYGPLPFLPPECLNAVVLQATLGHAEGRSFGLSPAADHRVRSTSEFARHVHDVSELWGRRLQQSRTIFLAGADTLHQPVEQVEAYLDALGWTIPIRSQDDGEDRCFGVHAFLDDFRGSRLGREGWIRLAERGLVRISLGIESGDPQVRAIYGKSWEDADFRATVAELKSAGVGVSVLTLVGAGGIEFADAHLEQTTRLIESLELAVGDFVFLLDENEVRDSSVKPTGLTLLSRADWSEQQLRFKEALAPLKGRGIKVLPYTLEKQWT